jgi:two-component system sensor histidine kinase RpfC
LLASKRALVVDGDHRERQRLVEFLEGWGIAVEVTANPLQGLALLWEATQTGQPIDLVLFGPHGHRIPAEQFASLVRCEKRLTALPMFHLGQGAGAMQTAVLRRAGFSESIPAPLDKTLLFDALHRALGDGTTTAGVVRLMDRHATLGPSTPRLDILLADASPDQRRILHTALARGGHQIFEVDSGEQTIEAMAKHRFDLVIISLDLPDLGTAYTLRLFRFAGTREDWPAFIGLAQQASMTQIRDFASFGVTVVLPRPTQPQALLAAVADLIRGHRDQPDDTQGLVANALRTSGEVACLDERALQAVGRLGADPGFLADMFEGFLREVQFMLDSVRQSLGTDQGYPRLIYFGHTLQDNAGSLGALQLYQLGLIAAQFPESLFEREGEALLDRIEAACQSTRSAFWQYLHGREESRSPG